MAKVQILKGKGRDKIVSEIDVTDEGIVVVQTSTDPEVVTALQVHAAEVPDMAAHGMQAVHGKMMNHGDGPSLGIAVCRQSCQSQYSGDQNTRTLSAANVASARSSMVDRAAPSIMSVIVTPRASMQMPHISTRPLGDRTRPSIRSRL